MDHIFVDESGESTIIRSTWNSERIGNYIFRRTLSDHILGSVSNPIIYFDKGRLDLVKEQEFRRYC